MKSNREWDWDWDWNRLYLMQTTRGGFGFGFSLAFVHAEITSAWTGEGLRMTWGEMDDLDGGDA